MSTTKAWHWGLAACLSISTASLLGSEIDERFEKTMQSQTARVFYSWLCRAVLEAQSASRPVARAYAYLFTQSPRLALELFTTGGTATVAREVGKEALFSATKAYLDHPETVCMELANALYDQGVRDYRENYRLYRRWKAGEAISEAEKQAALSRRPEETIALGKQLFGDTLKYKYTGTEWKQTRGALMSEVAKLEGMSGAWDAATTLGELKGVLDKARSGLAGYPPFQRYVERAREFQEQQTAAQALDALSSAVEAMAKKGQPTYA